MSIQGIPVQFFTFPYGTGGVIGNIFCHICMLTTVQGGVK
jgi:hypothetical protein